MKLNLLSSTLLAIAFSTSGCAIIATKGATNLAGLAQPNNVSHSQALDDTPLTSADNVKPTAQNKPMAQKDTDGDGVFDNNDACPNTPINVIVDEHGCPINICLHCNDPEPYLQRIFYSSAQSQLPDPYVTSFQALVDEYRNVVSYSKFKDKQWVFHIETHTSKNEVTNELALSTARAEAIKQGLIGDYGIDTKLIKLDINTSQKPIAPNDTTEGRALNQRAYLKFSLDPKE